MSVPPLVRRALEAILADAPLIYVDCGARGGKLPRAFRSLKNSGYIGFEADPDECARLNAGARPGHRYIPAFLGRRREMRTFHVTASPACGSLLAPNHALLEAFAELRGLFHVERQVPVETISLDDCLRTNDIDRVDFLELDTQGSELEILCGADEALAHTLGVQVEVEFSEMYVGQPLFADIDGFLRQRGFQLVDLSRYRVRRGTIDASVETRGQLLWGHALYLRRRETLPAALVARLGVVATLIDVPDFAAELFGAVQRAPDADATLREAAHHAHEALQATEVEDEDPMPPAETGEELYRRRLATSRGRFLWRD